MRKKTQLLSEAQIRRMAAIAGIPALGNLVAEKVKIDATNEETDTDAETTTEATDTEETTTEETEATNEEVVVEEEEMEIDAEEPAAEEEISQDKIESLVDAVLAAIEAETGVPAQRVDDEAEEEPAEEPEMDAEEPEEEMMETSEPTLAERIAQAVQAVLDEDAALEESSCGSHTNEEEEVDEGYKEGYKKKEDEEEMEEGYGKKMEEDEDTLDEITKAVVARLRSLK